MSDCGGWEGRVKEESSVLDTRSDNLEAYPDRMASPSGHDPTGSHHKGPELNPLCVEGGSSRVGVGCHEWKRHSL